MNNDKKILFFMTDPHGILHDPVIRTIVLAYLKITNRI